MIKINIITVGRLKEKYLRDAQEEYSKRLGAYCKLNIAELNECRLPDRPGDSVIKNALAEEAQAMSKFLDIKDAKNIAMCIEGSQLSSEALAGRIEALSLEASTLNFVIGSSFGIDEGVKKRADIRLSMSEMTFPHQLVRIMLLEQLYRAFSINNGGKYHK